MVRAPDAAANVSSSKRTAFPFTFRVVRRCFLFQQRNRVSAEMDRVLASAEGWAATPSPRS